MARQPQYRPSKEEMIKALKDMDYRIKSNKRSDRKNKLKRVFNYDDEMNFLNSFFKLKFKDMTIEEFTVLTKTALVDTNLVSDVVFDFFIEELKIKEQIRIKKAMLYAVQKQMADLDEEITELEKQLSDEEGAEESFEDDDDWNGKIF